VHTGAVLIGGTVVGARRGDFSGPGLGLDGAVIFDGGRAHFEAGSGIRALDHRLRARSRPSARLIPEGESSATARTAWRV